MARALASRLGNAAHRIDAWPPIPRWATVITLFSLVLAARRPETILRAEFIYEDGIKWYLDAWLLPAHEGLLTPYAGYLHLVPRLVGYIERAVAVPLAPLVGNALSLLIVALIAAFITSGRLSRFLPSRRLRLVIAGYLLLLPTTGMTHGSITFIQFYLALFLLAVFVSNPPRSRLEATLTYAAVALAAGTGPFGLLLTPLFLAGLAVRRDTHSLLMTLALGTAASAQAVVLWVAGRPYAAPPTTDVVAIFNILVGHAATALFGGRPVSRLLESGVPVEVVYLMGAAALAVAATQLRHLSRWWLLGGAYVIAAIVGPTLFAGSDPTELLLDPLSASRYFVVPTALLGAGMIVGVMRGQRTVLSLVAAAILAIGIVGDLRLRPYPDFNWPQSSGCIGGPAPCTVPVYPGGPWDIQWPGASHVAP